MHTFPLHPCFSSFLVSCSTVFPCYFPFHVQQSSFPATPRGQSTHTVSGVGSQSKETEGQYLSIRIRGKKPNYYCTTLRSLNNTLISIVHILFDSDDTATI